MIRTFVDYSLRNKLLVLIVGALLLATTVVLAAQVWRHVPLAYGERVPSQEGKPVAA